MKKFRQWYALYTFNITRVFIPFLLISVLLCASQLLSIHNSISFFAQSTNFTFTDMNNNTIDFVASYENIMKQSSTMRYYSIAIILTFLLCGFMAIFVKGKSNSNIRLLTLPITKVQQLVISILSNATIFLMLWFVQLVTLYIGFKIYCSFIPENFLHNDFLFLSFTRFNLTRITFPFDDFAQTIVTILCYAVIVLATSYISNISLFSKITVARVIFAIFPILVYTGNLDQYSQINAPYIITFSVLFIAELVACIKTVYISKDKKEVV